MSRARSSGALSGGPAAPSGSASLRRGLALPFAVSLSLSLFLPLGGCKRQRAGDPEPPAAEIYIDPGTSPEDADDPASRAPDPARDDPAQTGGRGRATSGDPDPDAPPDDTPDFRDTLEGIPGRSPDGGRDGLPAAGTCDGGARTAGERWKVKCNTCTCQPDGEVTCTLMACFGDD